MRAFPVEIKADAFSSLFQWLYSAAAASCLRKLVKSPSKMGGLIDVLNEGFTFISG